MPPKSIKELEVTLQTQIQQNHIHHETHYNTLQHTIKSRKKDWESKQEVVNHMLHTILTSIPPSLLSPMKQTTLSLCHLPRFLPYPAPQKSNYLSLMDLIC